MSSKLKRRIKKFSKVFKFDNYLSYTTLGEAIIELKPNI